MKLKLHLILGEPIDLNKMVELSGKSGKSTFSIPVVKVYSVQVNAFENSHTVGFRLTKADAEILAKNAKEEYGTHTEICDHKAAWFGDDLYLLEKIEDPKLKG